MEVENLKFDILYFLFCRYIFIHSRPSGSNDTMQVIRKGSIRNRQLNHQSIPNIITQCVGTVFSMQCLQASLSMRGRLVSQSRPTPTLRHSTNKPPHSDAPTTVQRGKRSMAARVPRQRASRQTVRQQQYPGRRARVSHSKSPTECTVHVVLSVLCNSAVVQEATHACVSVVGVHRSVTTSRIIDPQPNFFRKLLCVRLSESVDDSSPVSSTTQQPV